TPVRTDPLLPAPAAGRSGPSTTCVTECANRRRTLATAPSRPSWGGGMHRSTYAPRPESPPLVSAGAWSGATPGDPSATPPERVDHAMAGLDGSRPAGGRLRARSTAAPCVASTFQGFFPSRRGLAGCPRFYLS